MTTARTLDRTASAEGAFTHRKEKDAELAGELVN